MTEQAIFNGLLAECPHDMRREPYAWAKWMRDAGYKARMRGDLVTQYIVDNLAHLTNWAAPKQNRVQAARIIMDGKAYMHDAKRALVPIEMVKPQDQLEDETVRKIVGYALDLSGQVTRFKQHTHDDLGALDALLEQDYELKKGGAKGNKTYMSFDGCYKVQVAVQDHIDFGPQLQIAKELIDECLIEWASEARPEIRAIVTRAFNTDKAGSVNRSEIFMLLRLEIEDPRWKQAMKAIRDAMRVVGSKTYVRCYQRATADAAWQAITIDLAKA